MTKAVIVMLSSSVFFWLVIVSGVLYGRAEKKKNQQKTYRNINTVKDKYGDICFVCNLAGSFLMFEAFSMLIAVTAENVFVIIALHVPAYYISLYCGHRILPHINNRIVSLFVKPD